MRRIVIVAAVALLVASSALAVQLPNRGQCKRLTKQLNQHALSAAEAESRGNALWARANLEQMERLDDRRMRLCPDLYSPSQAALAMAEAKRLIKLAAQGALKFFTLGFY